VKTADWIVDMGPEGERVLIHHKFDHRVMELGFSNHTINDILAAKADWPDDIRVVEGRSGVTARQRATNRRER
jgi:hypothetical protein